MGVIKGWLGHSVPLERAWDTLSRLTRSSLDYPVSDYRKSWEDNSKRTNRRVP
jgi:hypothetical protein